MLVLGRDGLSQRVGSRGHRLDGREPLCRLALRSLWLRSADGGHRLLYLLQSSIIAIEGPHSLLKRAVGADWKGKLSPLIYIAGMGASFLMPWVAQSLYVFAALIWLVPDRHIERVPDQHG